MLALRGDYWSLRGRWAFVSCGRLRCAGLLSSGRLRCAGLRVASRPLGPFVLRTASLRWASVLWTVRCAGAVLRTALAALGFCPADGSCWRRLGLDRLRRVRLCTWGQDLRSRPQTPTPSRPHWRLFGDPDASSLVALLGPNAWPLSVLDVEHVSWVCQLRFPCWPSGGSTLGPSARACSRHPGCVGSSDVGAPLVGALSGPWRRAIS